jgi:type IV secretion system protein TrbE
VSFLQRYDTRTLIFDLGGSYRAITRAFAGSYVGVAAQSTPFSINPFAFEPTEEHLHFLTAFVRVLVESGGFTMSAEDETDLVSQIEALYEVEPEQRRLLTLAHIVRRPLKAALEKWVEGGPYGRWFDNTADTVTLARFQVFDFEGLGDYPQVLEPLVFYILHRASLGLNDPAASGMFKVFVLDEAWRFFRHPAIKQYVVEAAKTWRKKNAALVVATQSASDLRQSELLPVLVESCPTKIFLANPGMDRELYRELFHLNDTEAERISRLIPKRQLLFKQRALAKVLNLHVDAMSHALFANHPEGAITA